MTEMVFKREAIDMTQGSAGLQRLVQKIYRERGFDFREYNKNTLARRLQRRLHARGVNSYAQYAHILEDDPDEYDKLFNDLTINVTSFFRDEVAFKALEDIVLPTLIRRLNRNKVLRIWSAGCATGEEPYSIAMLVLEQLGKQNQPHNVTILATDIDATALQQAKQGVFVRNQATSIRSAWRRKYFMPQDNNLRVRPALRKLVSFKVHNLVSDDPYKDLDLVVCRNVFIYFSLSLQMRVLKDFYDGLKKGGFLLLGKAEVPTGDGMALFEPVDKKAKLFRKADTHKFTQDQRQDKQEPSARMLLRLIYHGNTHR